MHALFVRAELLALHGALHRASEELLRASTPPSLRAGQVYPVAKSLRDLARGDAFAIRQDGKIESMHVHYDRDEETQEQIKP